MSANTWIALWVFSASATFQFVTAGFANDHFDRISRARQIAEYGEVPFRDFLDPGYFLTLYSSAFLQTIFGHALFGEAVLDVLFLSAGFALVFALASQVAGSRLTALTVTALVVAASPRLYDYDKVLFYPLGLALCWRYVDRPIARNAAILAGGTAVAFLYRYDNGVYIACAALVAFAVTHWRRWASFVRITALYAVLATVVLSPFLIFVAGNGGLRNAFDQIVTYARREGRRTDVLDPPRFVVDWKAPLFVLDAEPVGPLIKIRWAPEVDDQARLASEREHRLAEGRLDTGRTWGVSPGRSVRARPPADRAGPTGRGHGWDVVAK